MAERLIRQRPNQDQLVLASGITPSGVVHFGNFREVITVDLVARALRDRGKKVRFIFSWDDYDTFRKIPANLPGQEQLQGHLYHPIIDTPDPYGEYESYATRFERLFEKELAAIGIVPELLYQASKYRRGEYGQDIKKALQGRDQIVAILNQHRQDPLPANWWPVLIYCGNCGRDRMESIDYDGKDTLSYQCSLCSHRGQEDLSSSKSVKLPGE